MRVTADTPDTFPPVVAQACRFLRARIDPLPAGTQLPGIRTLAGESGISHVTLLKAIGILKAKRLIEGAPRQRIRVISGNGSIALPSTPAAVPQGPKWQALARVIERDILAGVIPAHHPMPSLKILCQRYAVSYRTLIMSLRQLVSEGLIIAYKSTYQAARARVGHSTAREPAAQGAANRTTARIALVSFGTEPHRHDHPEEINFRYRPFLAALERECFYSHIRLEIVGFDKNGDMPDFVTDAEYQRARIPHELFLGAVVFELQFAHPAKVFHRLAASGKPIAMLAHGKIEPFLVPGLRVPLKIFQVGSSEAAGRDVGVYLLGLGHRRAAYISPFHSSGDSIWSVNRLAGLEKVFASFGPTAGVVPLTKPYRSPDYLRDFNSRSRRHIRPDVPSFLHRYSSMLSYQIEQHRESHDLLRRDYEILRYLVPIFEQALSEPGVTAWVCAIDHVALFALGFLARKGVKVPQQISVIGFDDLPESLDSQLSTYHFDVETAARNMLTFVNNPRYRPLHARMGPVDIGGMIIERGTTAAPAG